MYVSGFDGYSSSKQKNGIMPFETELTFAGDSYWGSLGSFLEKQKLLVFF